MAAPGMRRRAESDAAFAAGFVLLNGFLDRDEQRGALAACADIAAVAPFLTPTMADGRPFRVAMTNAGEWGWVSDRRGYRYERHHPETGAPWPPVPPVLAQAVARAVAAALGGAAAAAYYPQCFLINRYDLGRGRLGLHQDRDERDREQPIVTLSLGADAVFLAGGASRRDRVQRLVLASGDALVMGGAARTAYHGIDRLLPVCGGLVPGGGRISITARRVDPAS